MHRIRIHLDGAPQAYRYLDSIHATLVNGLSAAGAPGEILVGMASEPWTFACKGYAKPGGQMVVQSILVSTAGPTIAAAMRKLDPVHLYKASDNGDVIDLRGARIRTERRGPALAQDEVCVAFASRFALTLPKNGVRARTAFCQSPADTNFAEALKASLNRRAGRKLNLEVAIDRLTLATEGSARFISLRRSGPKRIMIPAFNMPVTLRGAPEDIAFAFHAGMGAKANLGFGCPIMQG